MKVSILKDSQAFDCVIAISQNLVIDRAKTLHIGSGRSIALGLHLRIYANLRIYADRHLLSLGVRSAHRCRGRVEAVSSCLIDSYTLLPRRERALPLFNCRSTIQYFLKRILSDFSHAAPFQMYRVGFRAFTSPPT